MLRVQNITLLLTSALLLQVALGCPYLASLHQEDTLDKNVPPESHRHLQFDNLLNGGSLFSSDFFSRFQSPFSPAPPSTPTPPSPAPTMSPPTSSPTRRVGGSRFANVNEAIGSAKSAIRDILSDPLAAKFVRLAFHDCVGGGCDGCVDTSNPDNFGLDGPISRLADIADDHVDFLTRADVWVLASLTALEHAQRQERFTQNFEMQFVGRPVCDGAANRGPDRRLPGANFTPDQLTTFMRENFGFTDEQTVAILGAHTLGIAATENSGYNGPEGWVPSKDRLNNGYFQILMEQGNVDSNFELELQDNSGNNFPDQFLWRLERFSNVFMLNVDMALAVDFSGFIDSDNGDVTCRLGINCPESPLIEHTRNFATSNGNWMRAFHGAFQQMVRCTDDACQAL